MADPPRLEGEQQVLRYNLNLTPLKDNSASEVLEFHTIDDSNMLIDGLDPGTLYRYPFFSQRKIYCMV